MTTKELLQEYCQSNEAEKINVIGFSEDNGIVTANIECVEEDTRYYLNIDMLDYTTFIFNKLSKIKTDGNA